MKTFTKKKEFSNNDYSKKTDCMSVSINIFSEELCLLPDRGIMQIFITRI